MQYANLSGIHNGFNRGFAQPDRNPEPVQPYFRSQEYLDSLVREVSPDIDVVEVRSDAKGYIEASEDRRHPFKYGELK